MTKQATYPSAPSPRFARRRSVLQSGPLRESAAQHASAPEMFTSTPHVFSKVFAASHHAAMPHVSAHTLPALRTIGAAFLHLPSGGVVILLSNAIQRGQGKDSDSPIIQKFILFLSIFISPYALAR